ncbi:hypothetical protein F8M41_009764 [Gigaspora margarita]|uniref:Uncharacterized protein n=1 Tax=Gigaspora margarita TaxID=4874 RepID=A0A8H4AUV2_GIGMA|nr:hypothetical protein F8M41_009764 [Gigaspora margarita]
MLLLYSKNAHRITIRTLSNYCKNAITSLQECYYFAARTSSFTTRMLSCYYKNAVTSPQERHRNTAKPKNKIITLLTTTSNHYKNAVKNARRITTRTLSKLLLHCINAVTSPQERHHFITRTPSLYHKNSIASLQE